MLATSSGTKYVPNGQEDVGQYGPYGILSEVMLHQSHPESLMNQN